MSAPVMHAASLAVGYGTAPVLENVDLITYLKFQKTELKKLI